MGPRVEADASLPEIVPADEEAISAMLRIGYVKMVQQDLRHLATLGSYIQGMGVLGVSRGMAMVSQQALSMAIQVLNTEIVRLGEKPKKTRGDLSSLAQLSQALGRLSAQLAVSQHLLVGDEMHSLGELEEMPLVKSFAPGAQVGPAAVLTAGTGKA